MFVALARFLLVSSGNRGIERCCNRGPRLGVLNPGQIAQEGPLSQGELVVAFSSLEVPVDSMGCSKLQIGCTMVLVKNVLQWQWQCIVY